MGESKSSPRRIEAVQRQRRALELRVAGASFDDIAGALGYASKSGAYMAVRAGLNRVPAPEAMFYRALNLERLNRARLQNWKGVQNGNLKALYAELAIQDREARYLGLDAPIKQEHADADGQAIIIVFEEVGNG